MPKNNQPDLFTQAPKPPPARYDLPDDYGADLIPLGLDSVPAWLRVPGEEGYLEFDRWGRRVKSPL